MPEGVGFGCIKQMMPDGTGRAEENKASHRKKTESMPYLAGAAEQEAGHGLLDALGAEDLGRDALLDEIDHVGPRRKLPELRLFLRPVGSISMSVISIVPHACSRAHAYEVQWQLGASTWPPAAPCRQNPVPPAHHCHHRCPARRPPGLLWHHDRPPPAVLICAPSAGPCTGEPPSTL